MSGVRTERAERRQVAALPWHRIDGVLQVLLITSRETRRWVIPKGGRMVGKTDRQAAAVEAMEEAGVQGEVAEAPIGVFRYAKRLKTGGDRPCVVSVYPLKVRIQLGDWPEAAERERRWMTPADAAEAVVEADLAEMLLTFTAH